MTSSQTTDIQQNTQTDTNKIVAAVSQPSTPGIFQPLKALEYLSFAAAIGLGVSAYTFPGDIKFIIGIAISVGLFIFLFLLNRQLQNNYVNTAKQSDLINRALLYSSVSQTQNFPENSQITLAVSTALRYCQDLIDDYKKTRQQARNIYYILQMGTVILSGVTPILVLVDKLESGQSWLKWLPVICPAIASIVASLVTSFPFQENWISANRIVELLEAEQEKFILGATPAYRSYDIADPIERQKTARMAIANFISKVNSIHLKQVVGDAAESKEEKEKTESSESSDSKTSVDQTEI